MATVSSFGAGSYSAWKPWFAWYPVKATWRMGSTNMGNMACDPKWIWLTVVHRDKKLWRDPKADSSGKYRAHMKWTYSRKSTVAEKWKDRILFSARPQNRNEGVAGGGS